MYGHHRVSETNLGVERSGIAYVSLESFRTEFRVQSFIPKTMHIHDVFCYVEVNFLVAFVQDNEKEVETAHDRSRHSNIASKRLFAIIPATDGVCSGKYRSTCVECGMNARLGDRYSLLFHRFMNGDLV